eukprot:scaffold4796_cov264-Amphora_coffeaeformis.AAC.1
MQWFIASLIDLLVQFLEASLRRQPQHNNSNNHNNNHNNNNSSSTESPPPDGFFAGHNNDNDNQQQQHFRETQQQQQQQHVAQAYQFMGLQPPVSLEQLKKQYKKLCLRYHPDRNGGSEQAKADFQKLRAAMDWIEKDMAAAGVLQNDDNDDDDDDDEGGEEQANDEEQDEFYKFVKKQQEAQRRYREMQRQAKRAMEEELKRQEEQKQEFQTQYQAQQRKCQQQRQAKGLHTKAGRASAHQAFQRRVDEQQVRESTQSTSPTPPPSRYQQQQQQQCKPKYDIMECNDNQLVVALRLNMPQIALQVMNEDLLAFVNQASENLHFAGQRVTTENIKREFMMRPLDADRNNLFHYAIYYESYQVVNTMCTSAFKANFLEPMLTTPNVHGNTPMFFANLAEDHTIIPRLIQAQFDKLEQVKIRTKVLPALSAAMKRLGQLGSNVGIVSVLDTIGSWGIAYLVFDMHWLSCWVALFVTNGVHPKNNRVEEQVPGIHAFSMLVCFCVLYKAVLWVVLEMVWKMIPWELMFLLIPIYSIVLCAGSSNRVVDRVLYPLVLHARLSDTVETLLVRSHKYLIPARVLQHGLARSYLLVVLLFVIHGGKVIFKMAGTMGGAF